MDFNYLLLERHEGGIARIVLNRPQKRNSLSIAMRQELMDCLDALAADDAIQVVVIAGAGAVFCAGFDLQEFTQADKSDALFSNSRDYHLKLWSFPKPTIAAVNGAAPAGGFDLALLCDIRLCDEGAVFGHPEIKFGGVPLFALLAQVAGEGPARDLCFTGRMIDAQEALRMNIVSAIVPEQELLSQSLAWAARIAEAPAATLRFTKHCMVHTTGERFETAFLREHDEGFATVPLVLERLPRK
jgi:enoyl-CoA hydratase